jgi:hypothetical protein
VSSFCGQMNGMFENGSIVQQQTTGLTICNSNGIGNNKGRVVVVGGGVVVVGVS